MMGVCDNRSYTHIASRLLRVLYATFNDILNVFSISYEEHSMSWVYSYLMANWNFLFINFLQLEVWSAVSDVVNN